MISMIRFFSVCLALASVLSCASVKQPSQVASALNTNASLQAIYEASIRDAAVPDTNDEHLLTPIPTTQKELVVATWTRFPSLGPDGSQVKTGNYELFVTVMPEVQDLCKTYPASLRYLRLSQLLGLPPFPVNPKTHFQVLRVARDDLWRPCIDPDVGVNKCHIDPPSGWPPTNPSADQQAFQSFFLSQILGSYEDPNGYPFTRLGYTYDWNPNTAKFGPDEYVIKPNSHVTVVAYQTTADFCQ